MSSVFHQGKHARREPHRVMALLGAAALMAGVVTIPLAAAAPAAAAPPPSAVTDVNPNATPSPLWGGRVEKLALHPVDAQRMLAGTELGGLWRTTDGGANWSHVDGLPLLTVQDVQYAASDPNLVIAVGNYEGSTVSRGGIYRSTDGGLTWAKPVGSDPPASCTTESNARAVEIAPGSPGSLQVFVGDDCGLTRSNSSGADSTWTRIDPNGSFNNGITSSQSLEDVEVRPAGAGLFQVDVCGPQGFFRSNDSGGTWSAADPNSPLFRPATSSGVQGGAFGSCNIDVAPNNANIVYLSNFEGGTASGFCAGQLLENRSAGAAGSWTQMGSDVTDSNCREPFTQVRDNPDGDPTTYDVYFGTSVRTLRQTCDSDNSPSCATGAGNWPRWDMNTPHTDPTSIAFDPALPNGCPLFLSGDGGVFRMTSSGCGATPTIVSANKGLHAYDASQTTGTVWPTHTDLYFGLQDNGTFYTGDGGATYINNGPDTYNLIADRVGNPAASLLRRDCFGCSVRRQAPGAAVNVAFTAPPAPWNSDFGNTFAGTQFGPASYALILRDAPPDDGIPPAEPTPNWAVFYTTNAGANWTQLGAVLPAAPSGAGPGPGSHGQIQASGTAASPVFYLNLGGTLYRLAGGTLDNSLATNPGTLTALNAGAGFVDAWAVDPVDPTLLYAVSRNNQALFRSTSGGASWQPDATVTSLVTSGGYKWRSSAGNQATSVAFDGFSDQVMVGTLSNGIFASVDNGNNWLTVRGSKQIHRALDFVFDNVRDTAYVGSRGRGLWRIDLPKANLAITKSDSPDPVIAGEQLRYTITVRNDGPDDASDVVVVDDLPDQVEFVTSSLPCDEQSVGAHDRVTCSLGNLANGAATTFTLTVQVHANAVSQNGEPLTITNTAKVSDGKTADVDTSNNTATATTVVNDSADLQVVKICDPAELRAGQTANCTVFVDNHGPSDARGVVLSDQLLSDGTFTVSSIQAPNGGTCPASTSPVPGGQRFECQLGTIDAASTANPGRKTVTYRVTANDSQEIDNKARARSDTPDPNDTNNVVDTTITVTAVADLALTKTAPASATAGTEFDYQLSVTNNGPSAAEGVTLTDTLPSGVTILTVTGTSGTCTAGVPGDSMQPTTCAFGTVPSGATRQMTIRVRVDPGAVGGLHNDARAGSQTFDSNASNNLAHTDTQVTTSADLSVTKTASPDPVTAGTPVAYSVRVSNSGPSTARNASLVDRLPGFVTFTSADVQHGPGSCVLVVGVPDEVRCELGDLPPGDYRIVTISGVVKSAAPSGQVLSNSVSVTSTTADPTPNNNTATATATVRTSADLVLGHTSDVASYKPSSVIHFTIAVTNNGPSDAVNVVIKDALPPAKYGSYVSNDGGCTVSGQTMTCPGVTIPVGATRTVLVDWSVQGSKGDVQATASVTSATPDPNTANNSQTRTVTRK